MAGTTSYIIGIDIGTTNTKAVAFAHTGEVLSVASQTYSALSPLPDQHELDPGVLFDAVIGVLKNVLAKAAGTKTAGSKTADTGAVSLAGISFSCAMHSLLLVDSAGQPLTNAITWADQRSKDQAAALKDSETGRRIYRYTGTPVHPMSPLCKILWLKDKEPALYSRAAKFVSIKEYIWFRLFGKWLIDHSIASATGLFDIYSFDWHSDSLGLAGIQPDRLSQPVPCTHIETELLPASRQLLGLERDSVTTKALPFVIGGSDGCMANLGSNAVLPGEAALTIGTSGAIRMISAKPEYDPQERIFNYILTRERYVSGGAINNGGAVLQWYRDNFYKGDPSQLVDLAEGIDPGSDGLLFLPYLFGERAPIWNADARGVFFGIHSRHTQMHFARAIIEGISYSLYDVGTSLEETIGPIEQIIASGGFIKSKLWLQIIADIFNRKVSVNNVADASAIGAAMMGYFALGMIGSLDEAKKWIHVREVFEPDEQRHLIYRRNFGVYKELYARVKDLYL